jgi:hypothetical protein
MASALAPTIRLVALGAVFLLTVGARFGGELETPTSGFRIDEHDFRTGRQVGSIRTQQWPGGWSHVRAFRVNGEQYAVFVKAQHGVAKVLRMDDDGTPGDEVGSYTVTRNITNVEILRREGQNPRLLLHSRIDGRVAIRRINGSGELGDQLSGANHPDLRYKDVVLPYQTSNGDLFLLSISRWYGNVSIHPLQPSGALADDAAPTYHNALWKRGWSSAQIYQHDGRSYLVVYKMMDNAAGNEGGEIRVKRLLSDGTIQEGNHQVPGDGTWSQGYSHFRVIRRRVTVPGPDDFDFGTQQPGAAGARSAAERELAAGALP